MEITVLASSSRGNCYLVADGGQSLLLDCGIRFHDIQRGIGFSFSSVAGCLVTHEHGDHAKAVQDVMKAGVDVYTSAGTWEALGFTGHRARTVKAMQQVRIGPWTVLPFDAVHDAAEPLGFLLASSTGAKLLYLTDSAYCKYRFQGLTHLLIECNHSVELLRQSVANGSIPLAHKNRVLTSHMSLERCLDFLKANDLRAVEEIHLIHLSDQNSDADGFKRAVAAATGKPVFVAPG